MWHFQRYRIVRWKLSKVRVMQMVLTVQGTSQLPAYSGWVFSWVPLSFLRSSKCQSQIDPHFFSLLEFHTDKSTNCTLLGPVDCDSFYKWIPLNRWPVAISSEVLHFTYCISILIHVHLVVLCLFASLGAGSEVWVWRKSGGLCRRAGLCGRKDSHWSRQIHSLFIDFSHTHTHWHAHYQVFFLIIINIF